MMQTHTRTRIHTQTRALACENIHAHAKTPPRDRAESPRDDMRSNRRIKDGRFLEPLATPMANNWSWLILTYPFTYIQFTPLQLSMNYKRQPSNLFTID